MCPCEYVVVPIVCNGTSGFTDVGCWLTDGEKSVLGMSVDPGRLITCTFLVFTVDWLSCVMAVPV